MASPAPPAPVGSRWIIDREGLSRLLAALAGRGYTVVGPTVRDGAIVYGELRGLEDLPEGVGDEQAPGRYALRKRADRALFGYVVGPHSWKKYLFPPETRLLTARRTGRRVSFEAEPLPERKFAFLAVRACELAAIEVQDKVFGGGPYADPLYGALRGGAFLIAVQCTESGANCFCASMGTGPRSRRGFDLALTERLAEGGSDFLAEVGTTRGGELLARLPRTEAPASRVQEAEEAVERCGREMRKSLPAEGIKELLEAAPDHPRWDDVASRCLSCANCTMACPTCFCSSVEETGDLRGDHAERWRRWDSCFTNDFSHLHGGSVRSSTRSKYRQWMTHKLASWHDQFGSSGCVGCGRCITWCPAAIDITEEAKAMRAAPEAVREAKSEKGA